jgi:hypothetical protein
LTLEDLDQRREEINDRLDWIGFVLNESWETREAKTGRYIA